MYAYPPSVVILAKEFLKVPWQSRGPRRPRQQGPDPTALRCMAPKKQAAKVDVHVLQEIASLGSPPQAGKGVNGWDKQPVSK